MVRWMIVAARVCLKTAFVVVALGVLEMQQYDGAELAAATRAARAAGVPRHDSYGGTTMKEMPMPVTVNGGASYGQG